MMTCLAALDWNNNSDRPAKLSKDGKPLYRVKIDRYGNNSVVPVKVTKSYQWQTDIFQACVKGLMTGQIPQHQVSIQSSFYLLFKNAYFPVPCRWGRKL